MKRFLILLMGLVMIISMNSGCKSQKETGNITTEAETTSVATETETVVEEKVAKEPYEITFVHPGDPAKDMDLVVKEFYSRTKDELNLTLNFVHAGWDAIGQKSALMISSGEKIDSAFFAQWTSPNIMEAALNEQVLNLDKYFNNDQYPGLKAAFSEEYLSTNKFLGPDGEYHVYGIPFSHSYQSGSYIYYRKDLADKYGITIKSTEDLTKFYDAILENEEGMTPLLFLGAQDLLSNACAVLFNTSTPQKHNTGGSGVIIKDDGTAYVSRNYIPAKDPEYAKYLDDKNPYKADPFWDLKIAREFYEKGYVSADILNEKDSHGAFVAGRGASFVSGADIYTMLSDGLSTSVPGAEVGYFTTSYNFRNDIKGQEPATFQAWNFAAIPATCEDPDRVMEFYDWIFSSQVNLDLFEYGIEGKHWTADGDDKYTSIANPDTGNFYDFGGFLMTWNPTMYRVSSKIPDDILDLMKKTSDQDYFVKDVTAGFSFNDENVKTEFALITEVLSERTGLGNGMLSDIEGEVAKLDAKLIEAGWETYAKEYEKQFNEFLKTHPYMGQ